MNPLIIDLMIAERNEEIRRDVQGRKLLVQYNTRRLAARRAARGRIWIALGNLLIRTGERIKTRYTPKAGIAAVGDRCYPCP
jgi:hypothetical protein